MSEHLVVNIERQSGERRPLLRYEGVNARGFQRVGITATEPNPAALVDRLFEAGWRELKVIRDSLLVGAITTNPATGLRSSWGDRS